MTTQLFGRTWSAETTDPPRLTDRQWSVVGVLGIILIVMAVLQLVSFNEFRDLLAQAGLGGPTAWSIAIILAELAAAVGFFKLRLSRLLRLTSATLALLVGSFWFVLTVKLVTMGGEGKFAGSGFFGKFLEQVPGWWTMIEATILLFLVLYSLDVVKNSPTATAKKRK